MVKNYHGTIFILKLKHCSILSFVIFDTFYCKYLHNLLQHLLIFVIAECMKRASSQLMKDNEISNCSEHHQNPSVNFLIGKHCRKLLY